MLPPKRQSVSRRGFLAAMAATSAAVGALALSARGADATAWPAVATGGSIDSTARAASQRANDTAPPARATGANATVDQMASAAHITAIRPFVVDVPDADLDDLRRRLTATRWSDQETVADQSQGVQLARLRPLVKYWGTDYDWRKAETRLNALPQFITEIDGLDIYFIHVRSRHANALPLLITHGWPGSILEMLKVVGPLTDPTALAAVPRMPLTSSSRRFPATASPASQPARVGTPTASREPGRS